MVTQGISDSDGKIYFKMQQNRVMYFSHLNYGSWSLNKKQLQKTIADGFIYREKNYT